ncbi:MULTISPECIES: alpha/beta hydrolase [Anaerolinea]|uniref:alpha/beta hydrolase n=1 Tax=Anaerolinea TaxID=233189 RepID=UPI002629BFA5|nr:alpha/beta hydrolase-fold protein [Anaerolinea thermophila]
MTDQIIQSTPLYGLIEIPQTIPVDYLILFLHGWTGDENSMQIFSHVAPSSAGKIFLRGQLPAPTGFGWAPPRQGEWIPMEKFKPAAYLIHQTLEQIQRDIFQNRNLSVIPVGFSQGGAMALALVYFYPEQFFRAAVLSGFLPEIHSNELAFHQKSIFLSHGVKDEIIPVEMARESVRRLKQAGAYVQYCESQTAHKTSAECLKQLKIFLEAGSSRLSGTDKGNQTEEYP